MWSTRFEKQTLWYALNLWYYIHNYISSIRTRAMQHCTQNTGAATNMSPCRVPRAQVVVYRLNTLCTAHGTHSGVGMSVLRVCVCVLTHVCDTCICVTVGVRVLCERKRKGFTCAVWNPFALVQMLHFHPGAVDRIGPIRCSITCRNSQVLVDVYVCFYLPTTMAYGNMVWYNVQMAFESACVDPEVY